MKELTIGAVCDYIAETDEARRAVDELRQAVATVHASGIATTADVCKILYTIQDNGTYKQVRNVEGKNAENLAEFAGIVLGIDDKSAKTVYAMAKAGKLYSTNWSMFSATPWTTLAQMGAAEPDEIVEAVNSGALPSHDVTTVDEDGLEHTVTICDAKQSDAKAYMQGRKSSDGKIIAAYDYIGVQCYNLVSGERVQLDISLDTNSSYTRGEIAKLVKNYPEDGWKGSIFAGKEEIVVVISDSISSARLLFRKHESSTTRAKKSGQKTKEAQIAMARKAIEGLVALGMDNDKCADFLKRMCFPDEIIIAVLDVESPENS